MKDTQRDENEVRLSAEYGETGVDQGFSGSDLASAALLGSEGRAQENIISWHAFLQNIPGNIKESGDNLIEEMQKGFPETKKYFGEIYENMKIVLDPKTIAEKAAESFSNMKDSFGKLREYVKNEMGDDISKKFNSFVSSVCESFSVFKESTKKQMTLEYNKVNDGFHTMYNKAVESKAGKQVAAAYKQAAVAASGVAKSAREYGDGVYKAAMNKTMDHTKDRGGKL